MKRTKTKILQSLIALLACFAMLIGSTFAWFTDSVSSMNNIITSGNLDLEMYWTDDLNGTWYNVEDAAHNTIFSYDNWEPGYTEVKYIKLVNAGSLALNYKLAITPQGGVGKLAEVINVYFANEAVVLNTREDMYNHMGAVGLLSHVMDGNVTAGGTLLAADQQSPFHQSGEIILTVAMNMLTTAGNEYQNETAGNFTITALATQAPFEEDSFGSDYDLGAEFPAILPGVSVSAPVVPVDGKVPAGGVTMSDGVVSATLPEGVKLADGADKVTLKVTPLESSSTDITVVNQEILIPVDVHIDGVAEDNTVPIVIELGPIMPKYLNIGNYALIHVEDGVNNPMTRVADASAMNAHNQFTYVPETGAVTVCMATFSEVAIVSETTPIWKGERDYTWYNNAVAPVAEGESDYIISNGDQLAGLSAIVGGMDGQTRDSFAGKTIKLQADINLGDKESENNPDALFYPVGYWNNEGTYEKLPVDQRVSPISSGIRTFEGIFDGNGHTIKNFYQNTWEMKGDHDWYDSTKEQYYRDGMGLFGRVYKGTIKNLTVDNFSSDGEITTTGAIASYADGGKFENIAITNCNPRVYNIGNGGIVGCVGWYAKEAGLKTTFTNVTVDNSNKISALWGSYDVACGGIVGQYYPTSGQTSVGTPKNGGIEFVNCHVAAQMDVYNDVCANYQYYAYRYAGMIIGSIRENETINGHVYPKMDGITASGCTVNFGTWNDYYYCEIIDNTTASYTHDYQMSRLEEIKAINGTTVTYLNGTTGTVPASGRANYVIVDYTKGHGTDNATCYHFKDGEVWNHEDAGYHNGENGEKFIDENGDGKADLKEDKQHIYLEFNNLFTGYGWGVTSKGIKDFEGVTNIDIAIGKEESDTKFESAGKYDFNNGTTYNISALFAAISGAEIKDSSVSVTVSPVDTDNTTLYADYTADSNNWENGTLVFYGTGQAYVTITDYWFCNKTTVKVNISDRVPEQLFVKKFLNESFLYRVGNENSVSFGALFGEAKAVSDDAVTVLVETKTGNASASVKCNSAVWEKGTIQFSGTGVVSVTITEAGNDYCIPTKLVLEVVDATNATGAANATANNVVLLQDAGFGSLEVSGGYTLYGNGFTLTCGSDSAALDFGYSFVTLDNGTLDNVQIVCPNFDYAALYKSNLTSNDNRSSTDSSGKTRYYNAKSGVMVSGNSQILNSRISGGRAAVNVTGGNCVIDNSRIEGGAVANVLVGAANALTLRDVTLVQKPTESTYKGADDKSPTTLMGFSVLYMCDAEGKAAPTTLEGTLVQQAWVNADDKKYVPSKAQDIVDGVMKETAFIHTINGKDSLNLGFAYMPEEADNSVSAPDNITDNRTDKATVPYEMKDVKIQISILSTTVYVYSYKNTNGTADSFKTVADYVPNRYGDIITVSYADTADGLTLGKSFGTDGWVYELNVDLDKASGYKLDFSKLSMSVNGTTVTDYKVNGSAKPTSPVAVTAGGVTYTLTATVDGKECTAIFKVTGTETSKESPSKISGPTAAGFGVAKSYGGDWSGAADVLTGVKIKYWSVAENKYVEFDFSNFTVPGNAGKLNGTNSYWEYTHTNNDFTLKVTNTVAIHSSKSVYGMPIRGTDGKLYFTISSTNGYVGSGTTSRAITMQYEFTDNNGGEKLTFTYTFNISYSKDEQYSYSDLSGSGKLTKLEKSGGTSPCVTPDTLVTLADGTQKRIDEVSYTDKLLVWNFFEGKYDVAPAAIIFDHGADDNTVIKLTFSDGTIVKVVNMHQFYDADLSRFVTIKADTVADYVGHKFAQHNGDGNRFVELVGYEISYEYVEAWGVMSAEHYNIITEGMLSADFDLKDVELFNYFEIGQDMKFDASKMQSDIEKYGLYTYEDFADYLTYEQFVAFNVQYFKIPVGKGVYTYEGILELIEQYLN